MVQGITSRMHPDFITSLSAYLAPKVNLSVEHLTTLIKSHLSSIEEDRGATNGFVVEELITGQISSEDALSAVETLREYIGREIQATQKGVPTYLDYYILELLDTRRQIGSADARLIQRYVNRLCRAGKRLVSWEDRQAFLIEYKNEPIPGTELDPRSMLYSQGARAVFTWRNVPCFKTVQDIATYAMLLVELRPRNIVELGAGLGGSATLIADLCDSIGLETVIHSVDENQSGVEKHNECIRFHEAECVSWLRSIANGGEALQRPCLVIEDFHGKLSGVFDALDKMLVPGDYVVIEDSLWKQSELAEIVPGRPYLIDTLFTDFFGVNCSSATNSIFRRV